MNMEKTDLANSPFEQFGLWFDKAVASVKTDPEAMTLATADGSGRPSARTVLLKGWDEKGFVFYTNYQSRKGRELAGNPYAALLFYWRDMGRQIRIEGRVEKLDPELSDRYFNSRHAGSRAGAIVSPQSKKIANRSEVLLRWKQLLEGPDESLVRPGHWGGFLLVPDCFEFWQAGEYRLHDRFLYKNEGGGWKIFRLAP
jgi:pyridoxamine 5'-phosphate oxidase